MRKSKNIDEYQTYRTEQKFISEIIIRKRVEVNVLDIFFRFKPRKYKYNG
jgi:hypothetical protein